MAEDQARARRTLYWLLIGSILLSLTSSLLAWQRSADRKRQFREMQQELTEMQKQIDALEAKAAKMKLKAGEEREEPVLNGAATQPDK